MTYEDYKNKVIAAQEQWNQERSVIYLTQNLANLSSLFQGETQPPHITGTDGYDHMSLEDLQAAVSAMKPSVVHSASEAWNKIGSDLSTSVVAFNNAFGASVNAENGWVGQAASAAVAAVNNYAKQSSTLPAAATAVSLKLAEMRTGLEQTQALMPGLTQRPALTNKTLPVDGEMKLDQYTNDEALEEARRVLRTVYSQVAVQSDNGVPFMPTAPKIVADGGGDQPVPGNGSTGGKPSSGNTGTTAGTNQQAEQATPGSGSPSGTENPGTTTGSTTPSSTDSTTAASTTTPTTTTPSGSPTTTTPSTPGTTPTTPLGTTPGAGRGGGGAPGSGRGGTTGGAPSPGRGTAGSPVAGSPTAAAAAGRSGGAGSGRGMSGMPGMGAPGAGKGQNDDEHKGVPDYLITQENGEILTGLGEIKTVPPVIGGDFESAQQ
ncbi:hypothetical protein ACTWPB_14040 [Nocardia sp. IBHARD005]|uniref:hypothetical protein n=1 Tax=Nocardia sp. IBHARD005 TaxID=3457765 RepID=UPI004059DA25